MQNYAMHAVQRINHTEVRNKRRHRMMGNAGLRSKTGWRDSDTVSYGQIQSANEVALFNFEGIPVLKASWTTTPSPEG